MDVTALSNLAETASNRTVNSKRPRTHTRLSKDYEVINGLKNLGAQLGFLQLPIALSVEAGKNLDRHHCMFIMCPATDRVLQAAKSS